MSITTIQLSNIQLELDPYKSYVINVTAETNKEYDRIQIGRYCFLNNTGYISYDSSKKKEYKRFSSFLNKLLSLDDFLSYSNRLIEDAKWDGREENKKRNAEAEERHIQSNVDTSSEVNVIESSPTTNNESSNTQLNTQPISPNNITPLHITSNLSNSINNLFIKSELIRDHINSNGWTWNDYTTLSNITGESEDTCDKIFSIYNIIPSLRDLLTNEFIKRNNDIDYCIDKLKYFSNLDSDKQMELVEQYSY